MATTQQTQQFKDLTNLHVKSSFELITAWIDKGCTLKLSPNAIQLMTVLLRFYNPEKSCVFPHQETLSERTNTSLASVKRGLNELIKANLIIKHRKQSGNVYGFTGALFELLNSSICTIPIAQNEPCMNEQIKEKIKQQHVVVPFKDIRGVEGQTKKGTSRTAEPVCSETQYNLNEIPDIIRKKKDIRNIQRYWGSLRPAVKIEYWQEQTKIDELKRKRAEFERAEEERKAREKAEQEAYDRLPLNEKFSRSQAIKHIWCLRMLICRRGYQVSGLSADLVALYGLDVEQICKMSEDEIKQACLC